MFSKTIEGCIEVVLHLFPLPLALVVLEEIWIALGVVEEARGGDVFFAEGFGKRNGLAGVHQRDDVNRFIAQPLIRYQFNKNWYITTSPIISSDWTHPDSDGWIVPVGGGLGYAFRLANQLMQISLEGYYNAVKPTVAGEELLGDWTIRTQVQVLFPH